jgi:phage gpG-like protein
LKQSVKIKGLNELEKKIIKSIDKNLVLKVGVFGSQDSDMVMIASVHEFGKQITVTDKMRYFLGYSGLWLKKATQYITIPERSFLRSTFKDKKQNILRGIKENIKKVIAGIYTQEIFMSRLGEAIQMFVKEKITAGIEPENHPFTIENKKSSKPLIGSGRLRDSIRYEVSKQ